MAETKSDRLSGSLPEPGAPSNAPDAAKALIVAPAWIGDMVMAQGLVGVLAGQRGTGEIHVVAPPATAPLASRMPGVAAVHELAVGHGELGLRRRRRLAMRLRGCGFQAAYVLPNSFKSALLPWWARIPSRVGWYGEARYCLVNDRRRLDARKFPRMVDRFVSLARPAGAPLPAPFPQPRLRVDENNRAAVLARLALDTNRPVTALCPGASFGPAKRWPADRFAAVARSRLDGGHAVWLLGSVADAPATGEVARLAPGVVDLAGRTSLLDVVDLLSLADAVVSNDSGLMHIACALDRKVVAVFGSTSAEFTPPLGSSATVIERELDCRPCFQRECPLEHLNCLRGIAPGRVIAALAP